MKKKWIFPTVWFWLISLLAGTAIFFSVEGFSPDGWRTWEIPGPGVNLILAPWNLYLLPVFTFSFLIFGIYARRKNYRHYVANISYLTAGTGWILALLLVLIYQPKHAHFETIDEVVPVNPYLFIVGIVGQTILIFHLGYIARITELHYRRIKAWKVGPHRAEKGIQKPVPVK